MLAPDTFIQRQDDRFADNEFFKIKEGTFRDFAADMVATFVPLAEANVPAYDPKRFYAEEYLVTFNGLYYKAKVQGFLPAPTPGQETAEWKPDLKPLPPTLPYREITAQQGRDFGSDGLLVPSTLYRFTDRVDAAGDALDDVLLVAVSRHNVAGADAYAVGIDPQTREEYLLPVSYELATDTTSPRTGGGGGPVDVYTKAESDTLLATKGSAQVQQQHTAQLDTLGAQAAPVMAYLADNSVAPFQALDEALAFPPASPAQPAKKKVYMEFHTAVLEILTSAGGWPSFTNCTGTVVYFGENVQLELRGKTNANLTIQAARFYQKAGTFGGQINVVSTAAANAPRATLPFLDGDYGVPVNLTGLIQACGTYSSITGAGTVYAVEPFAASYVDPGVTVVRQAGAALPPATTTALGGLIVGAGLQADGTGKVSLKIDSTTLGQRADGTLYVLTSSGNISAAATPTGVTAVRDHPRTGTMVRWDAMPGATFYQVYRSENGGPFTYLVGIPYNYYFDSSGPGQGDQFILYRVVAANSAGESPVSTVAQAA
jgi:hypothetical protein